MELFACLPHVRRDALLNYRRKPSYVIISTTAATRFRSGPASEYAPSLIPATAWPSTRAVSDCELFGFDVNNPD